MTLLGAAEVVRDFYERYPYPRPVDSLEKYRFSGNGLMRAGFTRGKSGVQTAYDVLAVAPLGVGVWIRRTEVHS